MTNKNKSINQIKKAYRNEYGTQLPPYIEEQLQDAYNDFIHSKQTIEDYGMVFINKYGILQKNPSLTIKQNARKTILAIIKELNLKQNNSSDNWLKDLTI